jgi:dnd system-associated protein 4
LPSLIRKLSFFSTHSVNKLKILINMAEPGRIRIAKDKADLVKSLTTAEGKTGPFQTYADVIAFAAALGAKYKKRSPLKEVAKKEPAPIALEVFASRGYDWMIKLLGLVTTQDIKILSPIEEKHERERHWIFEEYANGGLEILQGELHGAVDYTERILVYLSVDRDKDNQSDDEFDLRKFLN